MVVGGSVRAVRTGTCVSTFSMASRGALMDTCFLVIIVALNDLE